MTEARLYPCQNCHQHVFIITDQKKMAAEIRPKWRPKWLKFEGEMCTGYIHQLG